MISFDLIDNRYEIKRFCSHNETSYFPDSPDEIIVKSFLYDIMRDFTNSQTVRAQMADLLNLYDIRRVNDHELIARLSRHIQSGLLVIVDTKPQGIHPEGSTLGYSGEIRSQKVDKQVKLLKPESNIIDPLSIKKKSSDTKIPVLEPILDWIGIQMLCEDGSPAVDKFCKVMLNDGSCVYGRLNSEGKAYINNIKSGICGIEFPFLKRDYWDEYGKKDQPEDEPAPIAKFHNVNQGECLLSLAHRYEFARWETIYNHPDNETLRKTRSNPTCLYPGDTVQIPSNSDRKFKKPTSAWHKFILRKPKAYFTTQLVDAEDNILSNVKYKLQVGDLEFSGKSDGNGVIKHEIPADAREAGLVIWPYPELEERCIACNIALGNLDPVEEPSGRQGRLHNLDYDIGAVDGDEGPLSLETKENFKTDKQTECDNGLKAIYI